MIGMVDNCPRCGVVFRRNVRNLCEACCAQTDRDLDRCIAHMWKYPNATTEELSAATQVPAPTLHKFVKEGKLSGVYVNLKYPCECCGAPIRHDRLCNGCSRTFRQAALQLQAALPRPVAGNVYNIRK